jgi:hypothetical protein
MDDTFTQIGTAEITQLRVMPLDPQSSSLVRTEVTVEPGTFPIVRSLDCIFVLFRGHLSSRYRKIGDGLFMMGDDKPWGPKLVFPGRFYGIEQWQEFMQDTLCQPGPAQRYILRMDEGWSD